MILIALLILLYQIARNTMGNTNFNTLPVYQRSLALRDLSQAVARYFSNDLEAFPKEKSAGLRSIIADALITDASLIPSTIENVYLTSSSNRKLKNATFIHIITRNILSYCNGLEKDGVKEKEYINLLRREIRAFRKSFKQWRKALIADTDNR